MPGDERVEAVEQILRLRRAERRADPESGTDIASAREFLERLVGPTLRPAEASRLLQVSKPALSRWIQRGEVPTVLTPRGTREIPLNELIDLMDDVEAARGAGRERPLSHVLRRRRAEAADAVDVDRLLPRRPRRTHRAAELQSLAYHRLVAERLDGAIVDRARRTLERWEEAGRIDPRWAREWEAVLARPLPAIARTIAADTPRARSLRQTSPFAGVLTEHERRLLARAVAQRVG